MARLVQVVTAVLALAAIAVAVEQLRAARSGVTVEAALIGETPASVYRPAASVPPIAEAPPVVVIAHGFAGSRTLMATFATAIAKNGYVAVTFDFYGHGEHPTPLGGNIARIDGATQSLVEQTAAVARYGSTLEGTGEGLAVLGHSMASDIVVRFAETRPVDATIAVSMFSPAVTATEPANLLVIVGQWEAGLKEEALRAVGLATAPEPASEAVTYGRFADGTARRAAFSDHSEHIAVLFTQESLREAVMWLDASFGVERTGEIATNARLPVIGLLVLGIVTLGWPLSKLLPVLSRPPAGAGLRWRAMAPVVVVPMLLTPLLLRIIPTDFLPVVVGDYLASHFFVYGALTAAMLLWATRARHKQTGERFGSRTTTYGLAKFAVATFAVALYSVGALGVAIDSTITSYHPVAARLPLLAAMLAGTLSYFLASEWASRGDGAARGGYAVAKLGFVVSLAIAVALDFERLFFLVIIVPVIAIYFIIYGLFSRWSYLRTQHPLPAAVASALAFAFGISVTFPMLAG